MPRNSHQYLVTVYVPTQNRVHLLSRALRSIRQQHRDDIEVVVVDDCSSDQTPDFLKHAAAEYGVRWIRNHRQMGACVSRNLAIRMARGRFVTGLDDDDEMLPRRITGLLDALSPRDAFVCASDWIRSCSDFPTLRIVPARIDRLAILSRNVVGNQILAERSRLLECGGFDESLPAAQDYDLWIRLILRHGPARGIYRPSQVIHAHADGDRISRSEHRRRGYWMVYRKHRAEMDIDCRRSHLYNLRRASGRLTRLPRDTRFFGRHNRLRLLWHALRDVPRAVSQRACSRG